MSINVERFVNSRFSSNTYVIYKSGDKGVWVIDPGDVKPFHDWMEQNGKDNILGVLLTHSHFDHIYGLNDLLSLHPLCHVYVANDYGRSALYDARKNGSRFTDAPFSLREGFDVREMVDEIVLWEDVKIKIIRAEGHSPDSVCLLSGNILFTGDTLIKDTRTVTKLKGGSVEDLKQTISQLKTLQGKGLMVYAGHEDTFPLDGYDLSIATYNPLLDCIGNNAAN